MQGMIRMVMYLHCILESGAVRLLVLDHPNIPRETDAAKLFVTAENPILVARWCPFFVCNNPAVLREDLSRDRTKPRSVKNLAMGHRPDERRIDGWHNTTRYG